MNQEPVNNPQKLQKYSISLQETNSNTHDYELMIDSDDEPMTITPPARANYSCQDNSTSCPKVVYLEELMEDDEPVKITIFERYGL